MPSRLRILTVIDVMSVPGVTMMESEFSDLQSLEASPTTVTLGSVTHYCCGCHAGKRDLLHCHAGTRDLLTDIVGDVCGSVLPPGHAFSGKKALPTSGGEVCN